MPAKVAQVPVRRQELTRREKLRLEPKRQEVASKVIDDVSRVGRPECNLLVAHWLAEANTPWRLAVEVFSLQKRQRHYGHEES